MKNLVNNDDHALSDNVGESVTPKLLTGMFSDYPGAEQAFAELLQRGFKPEDINLIMSQETHKKCLVNEEAKTEVADKTLLGGGIGSVVGGGAGALMGVLLSIGIGLAVPGIGIVVGGTILAGLSGAAAGAITGGLMGALAGIGIPEKQAEIYKSGINAGKIILSIHPRNEEEARAIESEWRADNVEAIYYQ